MKLVDLPTAKDLQELGYDGEYSKVYNTSDQLIEIDEIAKPYCTPAPCLDDVAYWLREEHGINICVFPAAGTERKVDCYAYRIDCRDDSVEEWLATVYAVELEYDEALESAINEAIEIIKKKKL